MNSLLRRTFSYLFPYRWQFVISLCQVFLISGFELLKPWPFKIVLDFVLEDKPLPWGMVAGLSGVLLLAACCLATVLIYAVSAILSLWNSYTTISFGQKMVNDLRGELYKHLQRLSLKFHNHWPVGDLVYRITADTFAIQTLCTNGLLPIVSTLVLIVAMFVILLRLDVLLTLIALGICPVLFFLLSFLNHKISSAALRSRQAESAIYSLVQQGMSSIRAIQAFTKEEDEYQKFIRASQGSLNANLRFYLIQSFYGGITNVVIGVWGAVLLWIAAHHVMAGTLTIGGLIVFISYLAYLLASIHQLSHTWGLVEGAMVGVQRVFDLLNRESDLPDGTRVLTAEAARGIIAWENVSFEYLPEFPVLKNINLVVEPGEKIAIVGSTGTGKSTLVNLLARFYDSQQGQITINGRDIREFTIKSLRDQISMVLQPPLVFPTTIRENIAYGRSHSTLDEVIASAKVAHIHDFICQLPDGYETLIGEQGSTLSEGQKQRLTIARAILRDAPILILDEPTSAMDTETEALVMDGLEQLMAGKTTFIIAHRLSTIQHTDKIIVMQFGQVVEQGSFNELMAQPGVFSTLYQMPFREHQYH
ncbi:MULTISPECIES: ABC transporter ATP-binding protein [unclassified Nodularia (in: cyanobacteria)]|uniref:ABC transporter ATP-binding protein n=1 Tax=unclassified Nodularia (in: cyanobacteria) TaxID=2656917 RepID=UPI00187F977E|nr:MULTISPECIES: ABC transporter ATP-binding protein [unclassified Nodularia (in: cyanobacteria)]MBE9199586.1 ABC transporter ATP-binding protein [Nodularia sp. LEGE 06071]MCC2691399.1 ABC transporter ATP-binding protein [Nodularia sp. LEGE 04288]